MAVFAIHAETRKINLMEDKKIKRNRAQCLKCDDILESYHRHDFKFCTCGAFAVDGGKDYLRRLGSGDNYVDLSEYEEPEKKPKILIWDVETTESIVKTFQLFNTNIYPKNIIRDWILICGSWKYLDEEEIHSVSLLDRDLWYSDYKLDDYYVTKKLGEVVSEADIIVHHNGDKFDIRKLNARLIYHRLPPLPTKLTMVDTKKEAKRTFAFSSNSLDYLGRFLNLGRKIKTEEDLWTRVLEGENEAVQEMVDYNKQDVKLLEDVYKVMRPYIRHPNVSALAMNDPGLVCKICQSDHIQYRGTFTTQLGVKRRYVCMSCGKWDHEPSYLSKTNLKAA